MTTDPTILLAGLLARGMALRLDGPALKVSPSALLTDDDRLAVRTHREALVALLTPSPAPAKPGLDPFAGEAQAAGSVVRDPAELVELRAALAHWVAHNAGREDLARRIADDEAARLAVKQEQRAKQRAKGGRATAATGGLFT